MSVVTQTPAAATESAHQTAQVAVYLPAAAAAVRGSLTYSGLRDEGLLLKTVLTEALGGAVIKPWRLMGQRDGTATIIGYTTRDEGELIDRAAMALPAVQRAVSIVATAPFPALRVGQTLRFAVRLVPTIRQTGKGEVDVFLREVREQPDERPERSAVYTTYLIERLHGAQVDSVALEGFRLANMVRRHARKGWAQRTFPVAEMNGTLTVKDHAAFTQTLIAGIGRQKAFGFGLVRLEGSTVSRQGQ
jgi:CRISPR-associated protein Cas6/Cse3/CasE subtype I-E